MAHFELNDHLNGIQLYFDSIPSEAIRSRLKEGGWRWHRANKYWYSKQSPAAFALASELCNNATAVPTNHIYKQPQSTPTGFIMPEMNRRYCYADSVENFLKISEASWISKMKSGFSDAYVLSLGVTQIAVWRDCFRVLQRELPDFNEECPGYYIIFEYALPYESGRRPDVLLVGSDFVIVCEFKKKSAVLQADIDQVAAYARDLSEYHFESRNKNVVAVLVVTEVSDKYYDEQGITICSGNLLSIALGDSVYGESAAIDLHRWINSKYEPLPTIVEAARMIMANEDLPNLRRVNSTGIPAAMSMLKEIAEYAQVTQSHVLALVTGVPGAGKTFLGLQFVYDICEANANVHSVYLSGNGPLVQVLTNALGSNVFIKDLHKVENEYIRYGAHDFNSNVIVFDEGQRAWDQKQMAERKRGHGVSEPDVMIKLAEERLDWCVLLVLVGEGQEIHNGENAGISQWNDALNNAEIPWEVICPDKLVPVFEEDQSILNHPKRNNLDLTVSLRTHLAGNVSAFVNSIIGGEIKKAQALVESINGEGFTMLITRSIDTAKEYCRTRYEGNIDKRYGMLQSSKAWGLKKYGVYTRFRPDCGAWYNTPAGSGSSCCDLKLAISEFDCQGLELDMPIVCWGTDMVWNGYAWKRFAEDEPADSDSNTYRKNSYRVLLTRGRDGFIIFVPHDPILNQTYELFRSLGIKELG